MDKTILEKKLSLAISFIPEKDLQNFESGMDLPDPLTITVCYDHQ